MKNLSFSHRYSLLIVIGICVTACIPFNPSERAAVVISNKINVELNYQLLLSERWNASEKIAAGESSYVFQYDFDTRVFKIPPQLTGIRLQLAGCDVTIQLEDLEDFLVRDKDGRYVWELEVVEGNLEKLGCMIEI